MNNMDYQAQSSGGSMIGLLIGLVIELGLIAFFIACGWKIFTKAGKPGWASIIPFYNYMVQCEIIGKGQFWWLWMLVPFYGIYIAILMVNGLAKSFGKDTGFVIGLLLLPIVFIPMLAFGSATYQGPYYAQAGGQAVAA